MLNYQLLYDEANQEFRDQDQHRIPDGKGERGSQTMVLLSVSAAMGESSCQGMGVGSSN